MNINPQNLKKLEMLRSQLAESDSNHNKTSESKSHKSLYQHPIETENDPEKLFKELIKASTDGNIPPHLLTRLKELENKKISRNMRKGQSSSPLDKNFSNDSPSNYKKQQTAFPKQPQIRPASKEESLYITFGQLLLEEES